MRLDISSWNNTISYFIIICASCHKQYIVKQAVWTALKIWSLVVKELRGLQKFKCMFCHGTLHGDSLTLSSGSRSSLFLSLVTPFPNVSHKCIWNWPSSWSTVIGYSNLKFPWFQGNNPQTVLANTGVFCLLLNQNNQGKLGRLPQKALKNKWVEKDGRSDLKFN